MKVCHPSRDELLEKGSRWELRQQLSQPFPALAALPGRTGGHIPRLLDLCHQVSPVSLELPQPGQEHPQSAQGTVGHHEEPIG